MGDSRVSRSDGGRHRVSVGVHWGRRSALYVAVGDVCFHGSVVPAAVGAALAGVGGHRHTRRRNVRRRCGARAHAHAAASARRRRPAPPPRSRAPPPGIPKFYRWLAERYPLLNMSVAATEAPPEMDNLYLDMNGIIHNCTHANDPNLKLTEAEMVVRIFTYLDKLIQIIKPQKLVFMAIDGARRPRRRGPVCNARSSSRSSSSSSRSSSSGSRMASSSGSCVATSAAATGPKKEQADGLRAHQVPPRRQRPASVWQPCRQNRRFAEG